VGANLSEMPRPGRRNSALTERSLNIDRSYNTYRQPYTPGFLSFTFFVTIPKHQARCPALATTCQTKARVGLSNRGTRMFNSTNRTVARRSIALTALALALLAACGKSSPATSGGGETRAAASDNARQVVITGAINKTYSPREVAAVEIGDYVGINVNEKSVCGVSLQFPIDWCYRRLLNPGLPSQVRFDHL